MLNRIVFGLAIAAALLAAVFFRYDVQVSPAHGDIEATVYRVDRWTGTVELLTSRRTIRLGQ